MGLIAVVGVALGVFLTRKLDRVSTAARRLASGDLEARSEVDGSDEIGRLGQTFDVMASALEADRQQIAQAEEALRDSEEHYRSLVENAPISIHEIGLDGRLVSISEAGRRMMELSEDCLGTPFLDVVDDVHRAHVLTSLELARNGEPSEFEFSKTTRDATRTFQSGFYPITDERGNVFKLLGLAHDITDRRRAERALEASEIRLRRAQKMEAIGLLAGGVAHDFNNILTVINGYSELMLRLEDLPQRERVEEISKAAQRASSLTQQLLAFSRGQVLEPRVLDLNAAVTETSRLLSRVIGEDIEIVTELDASLGNVKADPGQIQQVLMNLALNARDAMPHGGKLTLETMNVELVEADARVRDGLAPGAYVALVARDDGIGMSEEVVSHAFEPFFTTKEETGGTGLGLSTVYGIVKQSDGYIEVKSEPDSGSTFEILLPRVRDHVRVFANASASPGAGTGTILLVEDDAAVRGLANNVLAEHGYHVLEASDGADALRLLGEHGDGVLLMITDLVMPVMGGPELAEAVAAQYPAVKILFTTGYFGGARRERLENGEHLLKKPFTATALLEKVRTLLAGAAKATSPPEA